MLVTNPRKINHEELRVVAAEAKGSIKHLLFALDRLPIWSGL